MKRVIYIPFDHLHRKHGALKGADPKSDLIVFVESARMTTGRDWHKERLFFLISSARHFAQTLEAEGYYKFWMGAPEQHHNIRNAVMVKQSNLLHRYDWVDELVIPKGERCDVEIFEQNRRTCNWTDILVRMFVLKQEYRIEHMRKQGHINYTGALTSSKVPKPS